MALETNGAGIILETVEDMPALVERARPLNKRRQRALDKQLMRHNPGWMPSSF
jgi:hypothetical protein